MGTAHLEAELTAGSMLTKQMENAFSGVILNRHRIPKPDALSKATQTFVLDCLTGKFALLKASKLLKTSKTSSPSAGRNHSSHRERRKGEKQQELVQTGQGEGLGSPHWSGHSSLCLLLSLHSVITFFKECYSSYIFKEYCFSGAAGIRSMHQWCL